MTASTEPKQPNDPQQGTETPAPQQPQPDPRQGELTDPDAAANGGTADNQ